MRIYYDFDELIEDFEFEVSKGDLEEALQTIIFNELEISGEDSRKLFDYFMREFLDVEETAEGYYEELKEYFKEDAKEELKEINERDKDSLGYVGMSQSDFI